MQEIILPYELVKTGFTAQSQTAAAVADHPSLYGTVKLSAAADIPTLFNRGFTHIDGSIAGVPGGKKVHIFPWPYSYQATQEQHIIDFADSHYTHSLDEIVMTQITENGPAGSGVGENLGTLQGCAWKANYYWYLKLQNDYGITSPNQGNYYGEYGFDDFHDTSPLLPLKAAGDFKFDQFRATLGSVNGARQRYNAGNGDFSDGIHHYFTSQGGYDSRNWNFKLYPSYAHYRQQMFDYWILWYFQRRYMSANDRHLLTISWNGAESMGDYMDKITRHVRIRRDDLDGDIIAGYVPVMPFDVGFSLGLWASLLTRGLHNWEASNRISNDPMHWNSEGKHGPILWDPDNGDIETWTGAPGQPQSYTGSEPHFPNMPAAGEDGTFAGRWVASQVKNCSDVIQHTTFTYQTDGGSIKNGYRNGSQPKMGNYSAAPASITRFGVLNEGQDNILTSFQDSLPIGIDGYGPDGSFFAYKNPNLLHTETDTIYAIQNGKTRTFTVKGPGWRVFRGNW